MNGRRSFLKSAAILSALPAVSFEALANQDKVGKFRVMTANIRVDLIEDEKKGLGWKQRKNLCFDVIKSYKPDVVCFQEVFYQQAIDIRNTFKDYYFLGYDGPEMDGVTVYAGIAKNPILVKKNKFDLLTAGTYWLSETPLVAGSLSWDTARARHANYIRLRSIATGKEFRIVNTHLDHKSQPAREKQTQVILADVNQYKPDFPQIFTGDFNAGTANEVVKAIVNNNFTDSYIVINGNEDPGATAHGFLGDKFEQEKKTKGRRIDFIFTKGKAKALTCNLVKDSKNGFYPSDHYFMYADIEL